MGKMYNVVAVEQTTKTIQVMANSKEDAENKLIDMYNSNDVIYGHYDVSCHTQVDILVD